MFCMAYRFTKKPELKKPSESEVAPGWAIFDGQGANKNQFGSIDWERDFRQDPKGAEVRTLSIPSREPSLVLSWWKQTMLYDLVTTLQAD